MSSYKKLQERCIDLNLHPCHGKGVTKSVLRTKIKQHLNLEKQAEIENPTFSLCEQEIYEHDPSFHDAIVNIIPKISDERPKDTLTQMKKEDVNQWCLILDELKALSRDTEEGQEDRELMNAINSGNPKRILSYIHEKRYIMERFLITYPTLSFLSSYISPTATIHHLLFEMGPFSLSNTVKEMDEQWI